MWGHKWKSKYLGQQYIELFEVNSSFRNDAPNLLLAFAHDLDVIGKRSLKQSKITFIILEKKALGLLINEDKTKYHHQR